MRGAWNQLPVIIKGPLLASVGSWLAAGLLLGAYGIEVYFRLPRTPTWILTVTLALAGVSALIFGVVMLVYPFVRIAGVFREGWAEGKARR